VRHFIRTFPVTLGLSTLALAQAGIEGQRDLLFPTPAPSAPTTLVVARAPQAPAPFAAPFSTPPAEAAEVPQELPELPPMPEAAQATAPAPTGSVSTGRAIVGEYDFGEVIQTLQTSVQPLAGQLEGGFQQFVTQLDESIRLMETGKNKEAVALSADAVEGVLQSRDAIIKPLWEAQFYLNTQIANVRSRLAGSLTADDPATNAGKAEAESARMLDSIASRIATTSDPVRKRQLVSHYRTIRTLSKVRKASMLMTPDQRKLWFGVVRVLEQASAAHQQVLMGCETLYAQLDGTASQLRDYLGLMQTVEGVDALLGSFEGGGMEGFVESMRSLQDQMETFSQSMEGALQVSMGELESRVESMQGAADGKDGSILAPSSIDDELQSRIDRVAPSAASKE
jgi:hypothetical protein